MYNIMLQVDGLDLSEYIQQETDITETMRRVTGRAQDVGIDGTTIPDLIKVKWDPAFLLKPLKQPVVAALIEIMEREEVTVAYTSVRFNGQLRTIQAMPVSMRVKFATMHNGSRVYDATPISFEEI